MRTITCFGDQTSSTFLIIGSVSLTKITRLTVQTDNFVNVNVFNSVTSLCTLLPLRFALFLNNGLKPQVEGIKMVTV